MKIFRIKDSLSVDSGCSICIVCGTIVDGIVTNCPAGCYPYNCMVSMTAACASGIVLFGNEQLDCLEEIETL